MSARPCCGCNCGPRWCSCGGCCVKLPRHVRARLALSALNFLAAPGGYRVFASDQGRLWATTTSRPAVDYKRGMKPVGVPDAIDADSAPEMAAKLRARLGQ